MVKQIDKNEARLRRHRRVRNKISGTAARPRLDVFRSAKHIYAQIIDDEQGVTLVSASTMDKDFNGNGESDGEFEDMSFDGLHTDAQDIFAWAAEQPYVDSEKLFLSGQSMGGYIAASCAPVIQPHGLILLCPGAGMWFGCAQRADGVVQTGRDYTDMEGLCYKMAFNYEMAKHPDPFTEAKGYNGPVLLLRADDDRLVDEGTCSRYAQVYTAPEVDTIAGGGHNFATLAARAAVEEKTAAFIKANL